MDEEKERPAKRNVEENSGEGASDAGFFFMGRSCCCGAGQRPLEEAHQMPDSSPKKKPDLSKVKSDWKLSYGDMHLISRHVDRLPTRRNRKVSSESER